MVSKKRLDYGFLGCRAPVIPRAPRSIRRRGPRKDSFEDSKLCAFELLAAVAGKLLQDSESSASSNVAEGKVKQGTSGNGNGNGKGQLIDDKALKSDSFEHGTCAESACFPEISIQEQTLLPSFREKPQCQFDPILEHTSEPVSPDVLEKVDCGVKHEECKFNRNSVGGSGCFGDSFDFKADNGLNMGLGVEKCQTGELSKAKTYSVKEVNEEYVNSNMITNSDSSVQLPMCREPIADACLQKQSTAVKLGVRDDDEKSYWCKKLSTKFRPFKPQPRTEHFSLRKMATSKHKKVAPRRKGYDVCNPSDRMKKIFQYRKRIYMQERCQPAPIRKRKLSDSSIFNLPEKRNREASGTVKVHSKGKVPPHVKFSIKSFKVPELYIEVPESASVGSLKRTVMEAITAILGSGIRVGVLLQGKKVRDDDRTLQQAGISQSNDLDTLGFTLEPCFTHVSTSKAATKKPSPVLAHEENPELPSFRNDAVCVLYLGYSPHLFTPIWPSANPVIDLAISNASVDPPSTTVVTKSDDDVNDDNDLDNIGLILSSLESPTDEIITDGVAAAVPKPKNALVTFPPMNVSPLAAVHANPKSKRSELSLRRTRRPFSVAEVEALVGAVEKLGTGRWRDVKIGAFENADHRTYVDLKDKWKTLVHTASISPHQRRGEAVPQVLLDRVLVAHSYWSQNQSKQQGKQPPEVELFKTEEIAVA